MKKLPLLCLFSLSGCATLMHGTTQTINIRTEPPGAECKISEIDRTPSHAECADDTNVQRPQGGRQLGCSSWVNTGGETDVTERYVVTAPTAVALARATTWSILCTKDGLAPETAEVATAVSGWYWANIFDPLGFIGDALNGAMNNLVPEVVALKLEPQKAAVAGDKK